MSFHIGRTITVAIATIAATVATSTAALAGPPSPTNPTVDAELGRICKKNFGSGPTPTSLSPYEQCMQIAGSFATAVRTQGDPYFF